MAEDEAIETLNEGDTVQVGTGDEVAFARDTEVTFDGPVTFRIGTTGQGNVRTIQVEGTQRVVTVAEILDAQGIALRAGQSVSLNGEVVNPESEVDLSRLEPGAVPVILVAPQVNNG